MKSKAVEEITSKLTQRYVMGLIQIEDNLGVEMINKTEVELETEDHVWKVTVEKTALE